MGINRNFVLMALVAIAFLGFQSVTQIGRNIGQLGVIATTPDQAPVVDGFPVYDGRVTKMGLNTYLHPGEQSVTGWVQFGATFQMTIPGYQLCVNPPRTFKLHSRAGGTILELDSKSGNSELATVTVVQAGGC